MTINDIEFHDNPLKVIQFLSVEKIVTITYLEFVEGSSVYKTRNVQFQNVRDIRMDAPEINDLSNMEIFSVDEVILDGIKQANCVFLTGFGGANVELSFKFSNANLDGLTLE